MDEQESADAAKASDPLYDWWFDALPVFFGAAGERRGAKAGTAGGAAAGSTTGHVSQALKLSQHLCESLYGAYFGALIKRPAGTPLAAFEGLLRDRLTHFAAQCDAMGKALPGPSDIDAALTGLMSGMTSSMADLLKPLASNVDRTYGGLADAFGLAPMREFGAAWRRLALAAVAQRRAQVGYLEVASDAARQGVDALTARLAEMGERGESVDTMLALMRLCATTMDAAMHEAMQSPRALHASAEVIRASLSARQQQQRIVAIASEALNVPTRAEVDEAYREIQELKREVRRLRRSASASRGAVPLPSAPMNPDGRALTNGVATAASSES